MNATFTNSISFKIIFLAFGILMIQSIRVDAQAKPFITSHAKIEFIADESSKNSVINQNALIKLEEKSNEFFVSIPLFPDLNQIEEYGYRAKEGASVLSFSGQFPIQDFAFYDKENDDRTYKMHGLLSIDEVSHPYTLTFAVRNFTNLDRTNEDVVHSHDVKYYPARISFVIILDESEFELENEMIPESKEISVEVMNGIINRK